MSNIFRFNACACTAADSARTLGKISTEALNQLSNKHPSTVVVHSIVEANDGAPPGTRITFAHALIECQGNRLGNESEAEASVSSDPQQVEQAEQTPSQRRNPRFAKFP